VKSLWFLLRIQLVRLKNIGIVLQVQTIAKEDSAGRGGCFVADIFVGA